MGSKTTMKPNGENIANVVIASDVKTYMMAETVPTKENKELKARMELVPIGNNDIAIFFDIPLKQDGSDVKHTRTVCRFFKDK